MKDKLYKMMDWPGIEAIVYGEENSPQNLLGRHSTATNTLYQCFFPDAKEVKLCIESEGRDAKEYVMEMADEEGFYACALLGKVKDDYSYIVTDINGVKKTVKDPYFYSAMVKIEDSKKFNSGSETEAYKYMGAHVETIDGVKGVAFRVWAPNAMRVSVVGDFNSWNGKANPMMKDEESGIFTLFIPGLAAGCEYKYEIKGHGGLVCMKLDPYSYECNDGKSVVPSNIRYKWEDKEYFDARSGAKLDASPVNIYETEIGRVVDKKGELSKSAITALIDYLKKMGYNYLKLTMKGDDSYMLPAGVSAPNVKNLVNALHKENIGILYTWNPSFFTVTNEGMSKFDGTYLYGHMDMRKRYNNAFGGFYYNYGREEVLSYLYSAANYWMKEFHMDGFHIEGLSSMLYLDYAKYDGEWIANIYGGHENLEAIEFIKELNLKLHKAYPYVIMTTREESAFPKVTSSNKDGGLGFDFVYNNGFTEDYLSFIKGDRAFEELHMLTDHFAYEYSENYISALSKETVLAANDYDYVRVKNGARFVDYVPVPDENKGTVVRATLAFFMAHPGKKLMYCGQDDENLSLALGQLYNTEPALYSLDNSPYGIEWINNLDKGDGVLSFIRKSEKAEDMIIVVCNFSCKDINNHKLGVMRPGKYKQIFNSEDKKFGGKAATAVKPKETVEEFYEGRYHTITIKIPAMSVSYYKYVE